MSEKMPDMSRGGLSKAEEIARATAGLDTAEGIAKDMTQEAISERLAKEAREEAAFAGSITDKEIEAALDPLETEIKQQNFANDGRIGEPDFSQLTTEQIDTAVNTLDNS